MMIEKMTYEQQLNTNYWKAKRSKILERDGFKCVKCQNKTLLDRFRISLHAVGTYANGLVVYIIYDKEKKCPYRCKTHYNRTFLDKLTSLKGNNKSVLALTGGTGIFTYLISTLVIPEKIDYQHLDIQEKQTKQEKYIEQHFHTERDKFIWVDTKGLHIHHKYYQIGKLAWEYPNEALVTYCWECHEELHKNNSIEVLDAEGKYVGDKLLCTRCFGAGIFPEYSHIQNGICFRCNGSRMEN